ncbi:MAG: hypothetical protein ACKVZJ_13025 [Phycisphaerales bacterium]
MASDADMLKAYLADRDVPCPSCSYNLRGCVAETCPECGHSPKLGIQQTLWTPGRVRLLRAALGVCAIAYGAAATEYLLFLIERGGVAGMLPYVATTWVALVITNTGASISLGWALRQTIGLGQTAADRRLAHAFVVALAVPLGMSLLYVIQLAVDAVVR